MDVLCDFADIATFLCETLPMKEIYWKEKKQTKEQEPKKNIDDVADDAFH